MLFLRRPVRLFQEYSSFSSNNLRRRRTALDFSFLLRRSFSSSFQLYNSKTRRIEPLSLQREEGGGAVYTCGPTVYGPAHLGHARTYIWLDILRRSLQLLGSVGSPPLLFVLNITDVDDKILQEAARTGVAPLPLARRYERDFWRDWDRLHLMRPHMITRVSEYVESDIQPYIQRLIDHGFAYVLARSSSNNNADDTNNADDAADAVEDDKEEYHNGIYFDIQALERQTGIQYGVFAPPTTTPGEASEEERPHHETVPSRSKKRDPRDFALWKCKEDDSLSWSSPWGTGRPGWHIECSAMIEAVSRQFGGTRFVLHCGGVDLQFPHHTNEIAQAQAFHWENCCDRAVVEDWIPHWMHTGHLHIEGRKMSKSLKNFISIHDFLSGGGDGYTDSAAPNDPLATPNTNELSRADDLRLWVLGLSGPYRGTATYSEERLAEARSVRTKLVRCLWDGEEWIRQQQSQHHSTENDTTKRWRPQDTIFFTNVQDAVAQCHAALRSDLDGSTYVEQMVRIAEESRSYWSDAANTKGPTEPSRSALQALRDLLSLVGFSDVTCRAGLSSSAQQQDSAMIPLRSVVQELAQFRSVVRRAAIADHKNRDVPPSDNMKQILRLCDEYRDVVFPSLGIELLDGKGGGGGTAAAGDTELNGPGDQWRFCVPKGTYRPTKPLLTKKESNIFVWSPLSKKPAPEKQPKTSPKENAAPPPALPNIYVPPPPPLCHEIWDKEFKLEEDRVDTFPEFRESYKKKIITPLRAALKASPIRNVPPATYFKTGLYTNLFSQFDDEGFPLLHADGSRISVELHKKLMKIFVDHIKQYNFSKRKKFMRREKKKAHERRAHELLAMRKLPRNPPQPEAYWE